MKTILIFFFLFIISCSSQHKTIEITYSLKDDINNTIIDAFYNNDTIGIDIYLIP